MSQLWVIFVAGHAVSVAGNEFFHGHALCVEKGAELGGACEQMADEPKPDTPEHLGWEKIYCIPGMYYTANLRGQGCSGPKPPPAR